MQCVTERNTVAVPNNAAIMASLAYAAHMPRPDGTTRYTTSDASCDGGTAPPGCADRHKRHVGQQPPVRQLLARQRRRIVRRQPLLDGGCILRSGCSSLSQVALQQLKSLPHT